VLENTLDASFICNYNNSYDMSAHQYIAVGETGIVAQTFSTGTIIFNRLIQSLGSTATAGTYIKIKSIILEGDWTGYSDDFLTSLMSVDYGIASVENPILKTENSDASESSTLSVEGVLRGIGGIADSVDSVNGEYVLTKKLSGETDIASGTAINTTNLTDAKDGGVFVLFQDDGYCIIGTVDGTTTTTDAGTIIYELDTYETINLTDEELIDGQLFCYEGGRLVQSSDTGVPGDITAEIATNEAGVRENNMRALDFFSKASKGANINGEEIDYTVETNFDISKGDIVNLNNSGNVITGQPPLLYKELLYGSTSGYLDILLVSLSDTQFILVLTGTTTNTFRLYEIDSSGCALLGTSTYSSGTVTGVFKVDESTIIVSSSAGICVGVVGSTTITFGTEYLYSDETTDNILLTSDADYIIAVVDYNNYIYLKVFTISGSTLTLSSSLSTGVYHSYYYGTIAMEDENKFLQLYMNSSQSTNYSVVYTYSSTSHSLSSGTLYSVSTYESTYYDPSHLLSIGNNRYMSVREKSSGHSRYYQAISFSEEVPSYGTGTMYQSYEYEDGLSFRLYEGSNSTFVHQLVDPIDSFNLATLQQMLVDDNLDITEFRDILSIPIPLTALGSSGLDIYIKVGDYVIGATLVDYGDYDHYVIETFEKVISGVAKKDADSEETVTVVKRLCD
jgi:hypothetical protein